MPSETCHVFLDETGSFEKGESISAIGGFFCSRHPSASDLTGFAHRVWGGGEFHGTKVDHASLPGIVERAFGEMERLDWHPMVFHHVSKRWIVDNATTYVHVMADGVVRLGRMLSLERGGPVTLDLVAATRCVPRADGTLEPMSEDFYKTRLQERIAFEAVRCPRTQGELKWDWTLDFAVATRATDLMVADLVCTAWRKRKSFAKGLQEQFRALLGDRVIEVLQMEDLDRLALTIRREEYGSALLDLLFLLQKSPAREERIAACRDQLVAHLARLESRHLENALHTPLARIEADVAQRRLVEAESMAKAFRTEILDPLAHHLSPGRQADVGWARVATASLMLASANHRGAVEAAEAVRAELRSLVTPAGLAFERLPLLFTVYVNDAVHGTNVYDFLQVVDRMEALGRQLGEITAFFGDLLEPPVGEVPAEAAGKAYGTALQAATQAARRDRTLYARGRELSEKALRQFTRESDRRRQHGYRCQLETDAGEFDEARRWFAMSLGLEVDADVSSLAQEVARDAHGFSLMHYVRLWEAAARSGERALASDLETAWAREGLGEGKPWTSLDHPYPLILWKWGSALGHAERPGQGAIEKLLRAIRHLEERSDSLTLRTLALGARCDLLAVYAGDPRHRASFTREYTALQASLAKVKAPSVPATLRTWFEPWSDRIALARQEQDPATRGRLWRSLSWDVPY